MPSISSKLKAADLFCGAGGTTAGAHQSGAAEVVFAVNHWDVAIKTHSANFPAAKHVHSALDKVSPSECPKIDLLFASPECTHHSNARGGRPMLDQKRAGAWDVLKWVEHHRPARVIVENVREFSQWGPLDDKGRPLVSGKGKFFDAWLMALRAAGYRVDYALLNAADFGAATSRTRLFVVCRKGNRSPIFPEPTHSKTPGGRLPGFELSPWRSAAEVIDWSLPCPSIFTRKRPLADKTLARIEKGLRKFVGPYVVKLRRNETAGGIGEPLNTITAGAGHYGVAVPFTLQWDQHGGTGCIRSAGEPVGTFVTKANTGVAVPFLAEFNSGEDRRVHSPTEPLGTVMAGATRFGLAMPYLFDVAHGDGGQDRDRTYPVDGPLGAATSKRSKALAVPFVMQNQGPGLNDPSFSAVMDAGRPLPTILTSNNHGVVVPFLAHFYGTDNISPVGDPVDTITAQDRHSLITASVDPWNCSLAPCGLDRWEDDGGSISTLPEPSAAMLSLLATMRELGVYDIGFRMLTNPELSLAQGFHADYLFHGTKTDITRQIGNSVSPNVAAALTLAAAM